MRVCHVTEYCHASGAAGTERYVAGLIRAESAMGLTSHIRWLTDDGQRDPFVAEGIEIRPTPKNATRFDPLSAELAAALRRVPEADRPDVMHFHTFGAPEAALAEAARERGIARVFTYHSAAWSCRRGTMRLWGGERCRGDVRVWRCSACKTNESLGIPPAASYLVTVSGALVGWLADRLGRGGLRRRLAFVADTRRLRRDLRRFLATCDRIVSPCEWTRQVLLANGAPEAVILPCQQGVDREFIEAERATARGGARHPTAPDATFVVGYVGRLNPEKGIRPLVEAFTRTRYEAARLRLIGWTPSKSVAEYEESVRRLAERDPRVEFRPIVPANRMPAEYTALTLLVVPTTSMESGPLVLLEGLQMGVPVWGSDSVGQIHLLERHGMVVKPNTADAWHAALEKAFEAHRRGEWPNRAARSAIPMRTMDDVGQEMVAAYRELTEKR